MIDTNRIADNDVNGASLQRQRGIASGRNGSKAIQVVNQRNPCDKSKNREDKRERLFGCKDTTYVGTWNVRINTVICRTVGCTASSAERSQMEQNGPVRGEMDGIRRTRQG